MMSLCVLRAASRLHERIAYTKLLPARVIQPYRKQQYENQALKKTVPNVFTRNMATDVPDDRRLNTEELMDLIKKKEVLLIDVRGREEVKLTVRIPQSLNIPVSEFTTAMKVPDQMFKQKYGFDKPQPDDPVVFICTTGARSYIALRNALRMGYKNFSTSAWCQDAQKTPVKISADKALSYDDLVNLIARKELYLVDVREPRELQETGELPGSVNIPLTELQSALKDLSENDFQKKYGAKKPGLNAPLIFSCRSGARSLKALQLALDLGYTKAKHYKGGYSDWEEHTKPKTS
ncbi:uncharacterized protein LOC126419177 isoform X1 [Schistocerca serialis cubense]|uniref:uncharacterized protein LOC126419177 isoform X1 n=2 Tax=Schistocerca TaxID=7008 RepID=UPI00214E14E8|nr:uncharacterized protein LOC126419177 isoform X1 [Schistocerca serialis cubense]